ncbi:bacillithiol biosynthesis cysteine-adding enzyme BshC [Tellurirhabdus bombi]|uniref:bacillithiol biosynthesis cysteine-adding enzyme BshC n=1 Tax=Tellurirhabdus bombi TaxID=2907205 RepID=UPI001F278A6F|nr:bacillithiol biosynthesis cysteine-adding enzyme BshC [Tellurirhabdus bombi]
MDCQYLPLAATGQFSNLFLDYLAQKDTIKPFYDRFPTLEAFGEQIQNRPFDEAKRQTLVKVLERQYQKLESHPDLSILAEPNTYTVTTGHQLNIFTGPLYVVYKLITTINLAKKLSETYPDYKFVPVYWMATEDHDFAEINHFNLFGKTYRWDEKQSGAVGRINPKSLETILQQLPEQAGVFKKAYLNNDSLADAVRSYVNELFGKDGLICLDADDAELKREFLPVMREELLNQTTSDLTKKTTHQLKALGYTTQIAPRDINLFYLDDNLRERIVTGKEKQEASKKKRQKAAVTDNYYVLQTDLQFTQAELLDLLEQHPERFSPNVVLRPVYQEYILPNLAYVGGPSEVPYWLQLKGVFDHFELPFPLLMPRNFALYVNATNAQRIDKLGVTHEELFLDEIRLRRTYVARITQNSLQLAEEKAGVESHFDQILAKALQVDKSLEGAVQAERSRLINAIDDLEKRLRKAEDRNYETVVNQLVTLKSKLFPQGGAQDRSENILTYWMNDSEFINKLKATFDPLDYRMAILTEK